MKVYYLLGKGSYECATQHEYIAEKIVRKTDHHARYDEILEQEYGTIPVCSSEGRVSQGEIFKAFLHEEYEDAYSAFLDENEEDWIGQVSQAIEAMEPGQVLNFTQFTVICVDSEQTKRFYLA